MRLPPVRESQNFSDLLICFGCSPELRSISNEQTLVRDIKDVPFTTTARCLKDLYNNILVYKDL